MHGGGSWFTIYDGAENAASLFTELHDSILCIAPTDYTYKCIPIRIRSLPLRSKLPIQQYNKVYFESNSNISNAYV